MPENEFNVSSITNVLDEICVEFDIKMGNLYPVCRYALTGCTVGVGIPETINVMGKNKSIERLKGIFAF